MNIRIIFVVSLSLLLATFSSSLEAESQMEGTLRETVEEFSESTTTGGGGWKAYESFLHSDFTRWYYGNNVLEKKVLVDSIKEWWENGTRVAKDKSKILRIDIIGEIGIVRSEAIEYYMDTEGNATGSFHGYVTQVWTYKDNAWKMLVLEIAPAEQSEG